MRKRFWPHPARRGATLILVVLMIVFLLAMIAFAIDIGWIVLARTELQRAADSASLAGASVLINQPADVKKVAKEFAAYNRAGGQAIMLKNSDIEIGVWDLTTRTFTPGADRGNAVRVTTRREQGANDEVSLFFGGILGRSTQGVSASAVAMANPRDIAFVVDLSGTMNNDTEPCWATQELDAMFAPQGYPAVATRLMQDVFSDLGYGPFPGVLQHIGAPLAIPANSAAYTEMTKNGGKLTLAAVPATYRILSGDSEAVRKQKAYRWMIASQILTVMPAAKPDPVSAANYAYWEKYLDYLIQPYSSARGTLPPNQSSRRITGLDNPGHEAFPDASSAVPAGYRNQIGYRTYVQFMMDHGRDLQVAGMPTPLSRESADCRYHAEATAGGTFNFPPREQPTHAERRALIAALQLIKEQNSSIPDMGQRDWVSIITWDRLSPAPVVEQPLTGDHDLAMLACTTFQAVGDENYSTAMDLGLLTAISHIRPSDEGGAGRHGTQKIVVLLTDGLPNLHATPQHEVDAFMSENPNPDYYGWDYPANAALMQTRTMQMEEWQVFPVGIGLGTDYDFMDRMARAGGSASDSGQSPRGSGNPAEYEQRLTEIFEEIINNPKVRIVQ